MSYDSLLALNSSLWTLAIGGRYEQRSNAAARSIECLAISYSDARSAHQLEEEGGWCYDVDAGVLSAPRWPCLGCGLHASALSLRSGANGLGPASTCVDDGPANYRSSNLQNEEQAERRGNRDFAVETCDSGGRRKMQQFIQDIVRELVECSDE